MPGDGSAGATRRRLQSGVWRNPCGCSVPRGRRHRVSAIVLWNLLQVLLSSAVIGTALLPDVLHDLDKGGDPVDIAVACEVIQQRLVGLVGDRQIVATDTVEREACHGAFARGFLDD